MWLNEHTVTVTWTQVAMAVVTITIPQVMSYLNSRLVNRKLDTNTAITTETAVNVKDVHSKVNGRVEELITAQTELARAQGRVEGILSEQEKQTVFAKSIIRQAGERTENIVKFLDCVGHGGPKCEVLVIEDNEADAILLCRTLDHFNLRCHTVNTGIDGIRKLAQTKYSAIFVDLSLHGDELNGFELIKIISTTAPSVPMFVVTGYADSFVIQAIKLLGVVNVISKPSSVEALAKVFNDLGTNSI